MRKGEVNDVDYHFVSKETFEKMKANGEFIETVNFNGNFYGTSRKEVRLDKCMAVEFNGAKTYHGLNDPHIVIFYMKASEALRLRRMQSRGDDPEKIRSRIENDHAAFEMDDSINQIIDYTIDTEKYDIAQASEIILEQYKRILAERHIDFTDVH